MKTYNGAVFFVDILGFSALTKGQVTGITKKDYDAWGVDSEVEHPYSYLAATMLVEFRDALLTLKKHLPSLNIAQISDCAFIWSENAKELLTGVHEFMWNAIGNKGILCRGGLAYGEIIEVENVDYSLGAFVVGDAVTRAAKNEQKLKGPRIAMDENFPHDIYVNVKNAPYLEYLSHDLYHPNESEINLEVVDEYRWYLCDANFVASQKYPPSQKECVELTKKRLTLAYFLKLHPRMGWNSRGKEGLVQLCAGAHAISRNGLLHVLHLFETKQVLEDDKRSIGNVERQDAIMMKAEYFSTDEREKWEELISEGL